MPSSSIVPESHETQRTSPLSESDIIQLRVSCIMPAGMFFVSAPRLLNRGREEQGERRVAAPPPCATAVITTTAANRLLLWLLARICWRRRQWQPTPVLLPGKSHGRRSLGGLQSMGSHRVGHDWATSLSLFTFMHWRRQWLPTPVFLPGESQGRWSLVACRPWGRTELDTTEAT